MKHGKLKFSHSVLAEIPVRGLNDEMALESSAITRGAGGNLS